MHSATKFQRTQVLVWLIWAIACLVFFMLPEQVIADEWGVAHLPALPGVVAYEARKRYLFPWQSPSRFRKWVWRRYCALRRSYRRAVWVARLAHLALHGALTFAQLVDLLTQAQLRRHLGALPVLYTLLELLHVRAIINGHCPTAAEVDHGTVAMVIVLNRLVAPRALHRVADWLSRTVLVYTLDVPADKFNDDRLGRTLDAIHPHARDIWQDVVHRALIQFDIDLSFIFYDLTAFVVHGAYADSEYADFGFAHNTPMNKRKIKVGLNATADGNLPLGYGMWSGRTADQATVQQNMERLCRLLERHGWPVQETLVIGDRAMLNDELALAYQQHGLHYLAGLKASKTVHRELLLGHPTRHFYRHPLGGEPGGSSDHWGICCPIPFEHQGCKTTHRGLVVLSGPMRASQRQTRAAQLWALRQALREVRAKIGKPWYRTVASVQQRANTRLKNSPAGKFVHAQAYADSQGHVRLRWWLDRYALWQASQRDGRYLLVTNDWSLSPVQMLALYRQKDGLEKRFTVAKSDLKVSPIYLHKDERIEAMLLLNMLALLAYSLLERQARQNGLQMTTRRIIRTLESLQLIETRCWDGSRLYRLVPVDAEQAALLKALAHLLAELHLPRCPRPLLFAGESSSIALLPPRHHVALE
jgi:transposase